MTQHSKEKVVTVSAWKKAAVHRVTLPSTTVVDIRIPDLPAMIEAGQIPQHLIQAALGAAATIGDESRVNTVEDIVQQREFTDRIVQITVVEPKLTDEDLRDIPYEDKEMLVEFALRTRDLDALEEHIGGLDKARRFRALSAESDSDTNVESL